MAGPVQWRLFTGSSHANETSKRRQFARCYGDLSKKVTSGTSRTVERTRQIIDRFCRGSVEELVSGMVEAKVLKKDDIEELERFVRGRR